MAKVETLEKNACGAIEPQLEADNEHEAELQQRRLKAIESLRAMRRPFPPDYKFDRDEANAR